MQAVLICERAMLALVVLHAAGKVFVKLLLEPESHEDIGCPFLLVVKEGVPELLCIGGQPRLLTGEA